MTTGLQYDGVSLIGEYNSSNVLQRRYVHGPAIDEPIVWYEGSNTSDRRWMIADERGSISAITNASGAATNINVYDEYGVPGSSNVGRFQYTGQQWLADAGVYYYRARVYAPTLGRFLQTDPIGVVGGMNLYAYAYNDAVNRYDPLGLDPFGEIDDGEFVVVGNCLETPACRAEREMERALARLRAMTEGGASAPFDWLDTDGDGFVEISENSEQNRTCSDARRQIADLNLQIQGWNLQKAELAGVVWVTSAGAGLERGGRSVDTMRGGRVQNWLAPNRGYLGEEGARDWTGRTRGAFGAGRAIGAAYVSATTFGPANMLYNQALNSLRQQRRDLELAMAAAGCAGAGGGD